MDENYLDSLLSGVPNDKKQNNSFDDTVDVDAGVDLDLSDIGDISLDELDNLDDIDLSGLELDDIDFDDIDVTRLGVDTADATVSDAEDDFSLDELISDEPEETEEPVSDAAEQSAEIQDDFSDDVFDAAMGQMQQDETDDTMIDTAPAMEKETDDMDLDDLFSALGITNDGDDNADTGSPYTADEGNLDSILQETMQAGIDSGDLSEIDEKKHVAPKQKKKLSEIVFGTPDEEELQEEALYKEKLEKKKEEKAKKKEEKQAKKASMLESKKAAAGNKQKAKEDKKKKKQAMLEAQIEEEKSEKKIPVAAVVIVFALFAGLGCLVIFGTKHFDYSRVITKAADYFERQRYHLAYDEVSGVEVKQKDEELRDRIYTVMYVERLYESYENNMAVNRPDKALDALIRGLEKYDEHYAEAVELDIVSDIDLCRAQIVNALYDTYGLTEEEAYHIMELEGQEYTHTLTQYSDAVQTGE